MDRVVPFLLVCFVFLPTSDGLGFDPDPKAKGTSSSI